MFKMLLKLYFLVHLISKYWLKSAYLMKKKTLKELQLNPIKTINNKSFCHP